MGTELVDHAHAAARVAKRQQALAEHLDAHRRTIRLRDLIRQQGWNPVAPEQLAHGRARPGLREEVVLLARGHRIGS